MAPERIVILGNAGSGKSTLARKLGQNLGLPVVHLDRLFWGPDWTKLDPVAFRKNVATAVKGPKWVCEGNYHRRTFDLRLPRADLVIWMDTPRLVCVKRVLIRSWNNAPRPDLPDGCQEKLDREFLTFLRYVWNFDSASRPAIEAERCSKGAEVPVVHLKGKRELRAFMDTWI